jgi:hypothetical protein
VYVCSVDLCKPRTLTQREENDEADVDDKLAEGCLGQVNVVGMVARVAGAPDGCCASAH